MFKYTKVIVEHTQTSLQNLTSTNLKYQPNINITKRHEDLVKHMK